MKKPLYRLDDNNRKFWFKLTDTLMTSGLKVMLGDEVFYHLHEDGQLKGLVLTHVDDLILAGDGEFIQKIQEVIVQVLTVSKVKKDKFRLTCGDIERCAYVKIRVSMNNYARSIEDKKEIRKGDRNYKLKRPNMKE